MSRNVGTTLDYLAQIGPPAITTEVFPRNESDRTRFSVSLQKITTKWWSGRSSMAIIPGLEKYNFFVTTANFSALDIH